jgi:hypothetical protein
MCRPGVSRPLVAPVGLGESGLSAQASHRQGRLPERLCVVEADTDALGEMSVAASCAWRRGLVGVGGGALNAWPRASWNRAGGHYIMLRMMPIMLHIDLPRMPGGSRCRPIR